MNYYPTFQQHVRIKRIQEARFLEDKAKANVGITQKDFSMAYSCKYQNEIQSALWTRATINLFTLARFVNQEVTCHLFVLDNYKKDKDAIFACLLKFYGTTTTFLEEHIYSDGPSSEFKNQCMMKLLHHVSKQHSAKFTWDYFATGHGKGLVDGTGGAAKSMVRQQVLSKNKNVAVENAADFAQVWEEFMPNVCEHFMTQDDLIAAQKLNLWENSLEVTGISKTNHAEIKNGVLSIWNHGDDAVNAPINTVIYEKHSVLQQKITSNANRRFCKLLKGTFRGYYAVITEEK